MTKMLSKPTIKSKSGASRARSGNANDLDFIVGSGVASKCKCVWSGSIFSVFHGEKTLNLYCNAKYMIFYFLSIPDFSILCKFQIFRDEIAFQLER